MEEKFNLNNLGTKHEDNKKHKISNENEEEREDEVMVKREKFDIAIRDIKEVACFLNGLEIMIELDKDKYIVGNNASKLTNAIQWLNNWGD